MRKFLLALALSGSLALPAASAQTVSANIDVSVPFPQIVQTAAQVVNLLSQGVRVSFLTPASQPAATLSSGGGIVVNPATPAPQVTYVQVMTPIPGTSTVIKEVYPLATPISTSKPVAAQTIMVRAKNGKLVPLTSVMGRQAAWAKAPGLQKKPGQMPPGQLKQLCKTDPKNALCAK
ncbi:MULTISPECIES: hypothetical protein [Deinococcus]|jgi:hypothetical protein|uniref:Uncharacterized protein n=1 Tax=Deinococcus enclensis TaxID=1049582 RepID=A0ABT9MGF0_9DEIO|nr:MULTISPECIES: hypothetical protein [Deinococcus]MDP9765661.1 hypothetical protein [Deinococcus enclensis]GHF76859.1 hypothetical protein GCM10017782_13460 [Deinococcus ficus]